ncbi:hypothetical protein [Morganella psychrotolerans]|nr:hypothetical protein [Morganella psychrotolerans]
MKSIKTFFSNLTRAAAIIAKYSKAFSSSDRQQKSAFMALFCCL